MPNSTPTPKKYLLPTKVSFRHSKFFLLNNLLGSPLNEHLRVQVTALQRLFITLCGIFCLHYCVQTDRMLKVFYLTFFYRKCSLCLKLLLSLRFFGHKIFLDLEFFSTLIFFDQFYSIPTEEKSQKDQVVTASKPSKFLIT